jgi:hypothetical protein
MWHSEGIESYDLRHNGQWNAEGKPGLKLRLEVIMRLCWELWAGISFRGDRAEKTEGIELAKAID